MMCMLVDNLIKSTSSSGFQVKYQFVPILWLVAGPIAFDDIFCSHLWLLLSLFFYKAYPFLIGRSFGA